MSDIPEKDGLTGDTKPEQTDNMPQSDEYDSFETVFADPTDYKRKEPKKNGKKRVLSVIAGVLAVAVLVGGTITVIKLIPVKEDDTSDTSSLAEIKVLEYEAADFSSVTVTNTNGTFKLYSAVEESTDSSSSSSASGTTTAWYLDGVDQTKTSTSSISAVAAAAASISASRVIDTKSAAECGLDNPVYTVAVTSEKDGDFSISVGSDSPDGTGVYLQLSTADTIYLVDSSAVSAFQFDPLDFADTTAIAGITATSEQSSYTGEDGTLASFDSLNVSGKNFPNAVTIGMNDDAELSSYINYVITAPEKRIADNVDDLFKLFTSGVSVTGAYSYDVSAASLAAVGLDNPYLTATIHIGSLTKTYKIAKVDDTNCAVITDDSTMIRKVSASSFTFLDYDVTSFYNPWVSMQSINSLSNMTFETDGKTYSFDIVYDSSEDADETYVITMDGKKLTAEDFQTFYQYFVGMTASDYNVAALSDAPALSLKMTFSDTGTVQTMDYIKSSETKYQYNINGKPMGRITSSAYNKMLKSLQSVIDSVK